MSGAEALRIREDCGYLGAGEILKRTQSIGKRYGKESKG